MLDDSFEHFSTYILLRGADSAKYGTLMKNLVSQYSLGNNQYPTKRTAGIDALAEHPFDDKYYEQKKQIYDKNKHRNNKKDDGTDLEQQHAQTKKNIICYCCGGDHIVPDCPEKKTRLRKDWFANTKLLAMMQEENDEQSSSDEEEEDRRSGGRRRSRSRSRGGRRAVSYTHLTLPTIYSV